jgi:hypothetical protein
LVVFTLFSFSDTMYQNVSYELLKHTPWEFSKLLSYEAVSMHLCVTEHFWFISRTYHYNLNE